MSGVGLGRCSRRGSRLRLHSDALETGPAAALFLRVLQLPCITHACAIMREMQYERQSGNQRHPANWCIWLKMRWQRVSGGKHGAFSDELARTGQ